MKFLIGESRWHGARYYTIQPELHDHWDYTIPIIEWLIDQMGTAGDVWSDRCDRYYFNGGKIFFRNEEDVTLFLLRWA